MEKRKSTRKNFDIPVTLYTEGGVNVMEECKGVNISVLGISIRANAGIPAGTKLTLSFVLNKRQIPAKGIVLSRADSSDSRRIYGIKFIDMPLLYARYIYEYLQQHPSDPAVEMAEKRKEERKKCSVPASFSMSVNMSPDKTGRIINISLGGLLLETEIMLLRDAGLMLQFILDNKMLAVCGKVAGISTTNWVFVYRINFTNLTSSQKQIIQNYLG